MLVKDIMTRKVISVEANDKLTEVSSILSKYQFHGVPVVKKGKVIGIITETDFFVKDIPDMYLPSYIDFLKRVRFKNGVARKKKKDLKELLNAKANDIMTKPCFVVRENTKLTTLLKIIKEKKYYTIPVVNSKEELIGIVTQVDIINLISFENNYK